MPVSGGDVGGAVGGGAVGGGAVGGGGVTIAVEGGSVGALVGATVVVVVVGTVVVVEAVVAVVVVDGRVVVLGGSVVDGMTTGGSARAGADSERVRIGYMTIAPRTIAPAMESERRPRRVCENSPARLISSSRLYQ
jgi:hypothetical protein